MGRLARRGKLPLADATAKEGPKDLKLLALAEGADHVCYRYRLAAFEPALARAGWQMECLPLAKSSLARWRQLRRAGQADAVVLQRKLLPLWQLRLLRKRARRLIFDIDDAVFHRDSYHRKGVKSWQRMARFWATAYVADAVLAGNEFLRQQAAALSEPNRVHLFPTCVDAARYPLAWHERRSPLRLIWIGQRSTVPSLYAAQSQLAAATAACDRLRTDSVGNGLRAVPSVAVDVEPPIEETSPHFSLTRRATGSSLTRRATGSSLTRRTTNSAVDTNDGSPTRKRGDDVAPPRDGTPQRAFPTDAGGVELHVVSDVFPKLPGVRVVERTWNAAGEAAELAAADAGVSWLPDDDWSRGKCGLKVLQYMAAGLPVVANRVGVHREMIVDGQTGFLADTPSEWAAAVARLAGDPELRAAMGAAARRRVEQFYSVDAWQERFVDLLDRLTRRQGRGCSPPHDKGSFMERAA